LPVNCKVIITKIDDSLKLKALPREEIKAAITENSTIDYFTNNTTVALSIFIPSFIALFIILIIVIKKVKKCEPVRIKIVKIEKTVFFNLIIRSILAVYINLCIDVFVAFFVTKTGSVSDIGMTVFLGSVWVSSLVFAIVTKQKFLEKNTVKERIDTLYSNLDRRYKTRVAQTSMFFLRRLLFVIILTQTFSYEDVKIDQPQASIIGSLFCIILTVIHLCYYLHFKPFEDREFQHLEVFNEIGLLIILNFSPLFSDYVADPLT
jgi:hypothetical protein